MSMVWYRYKATGLIARAFDEHGVHYSVITRSNQEVVRAAFGITDGPTAAVYFISRDDDNDVAVRIYNLVNDISSARRPRVIDACNTINARMRYLKFYVDDENCVDVAYDMPVEAADDAVGDTAVEIFKRCMFILDKEYPILARALYTEGELVDDGADLIREIDEWRDTVSVSGGDGDDTTTATASVSSIGTDGSNRSAAASPHGQGNMSQSSPAGDKKPTKSEPKSNKLDKSAEVGSHTVESNGTVHTADTDFSMRHVCAVTAAVCLILAVILTLEFSLLSEPAASWLSQVCGRVPWRCLIPFSL